MGKDPSEIRAEIERTRAGMADTVDALAYKSDVKERTKDKVKGLVDKPKGAFMGIKDNVVGTVSNHTPDRSTMHDASDAVKSAPGHAVDGAKRVGGVIRENPLGMALGGLALGFVAGLVLPSTEFENERLGPISDQLKESVKDTGQELMDHGKEMAQVAAGAATDAVKESAPEAAQDMASSAKEKAGSLT
ncbi:MAG: protein of unknown function ElaB [Thermoleophilia bacterium]|nr:protein of unknown function ElaB [Thermoleophilia bacterium]